MWTLLGILLLGTHLAAVNVAAAGPVVCAWLARRGGSDADLRLARRVAGGSMAGLVLAAALGGALLAAPREGLLAALGRFPASTYWFAGGELLFSVACLAGLAVALRGPRRRPGWAWLLALASATNLLYHFPPLMAVIGQLAGDPRWAREAMIEHKTLLHLAARPEIVSLWIHFVLASLAGAAVYALWPWRELTNAAEGEVDADDAAARAATLRRLAGAALGASLLQIPVGAWVLVASEPRARDALMGQEGFATACFAGGVLLALGLMQQLAGVAMGDVEPAARRRVGGMFLAVAVLMAGTLMASRRDESDAPGARQSDASQSESPPPVIR